jgi:O-antigen ligase
MLVRIVLWAVILVFVPALLEQFEAPKAMVVRVAGVGALAYLAADALRPPRAAAARRWFLQPLDVALVIWLGVEIVCTAASVSPRISLLGDEGQHEGLLTSLGLAGVYFAARRATEGEAPARRAMGLLTTALTALAVAAGYALLQFSRLDPIGWFGTASYALPDASGYVRPFGTLAHPNVLGLAAAAALCACVALGIDQPRRAWGFLAGAVLFSCVVLITLSRGAWIGVLAGLAVVAATAAPAGAVRWRARLLGTGALVIGLALAAAALGPHAGMIGERLRELLAPRSGSAGARGEIWRATLAMWLARPWTGQGPDSFALVYPAFQTVEAWRLEWATTYSHAHNAFLHALATRGVLGALAALGWASAAVLTAARALRRRGGERRIAVACSAALTAQLVAGMFGALGIAGAVVGTVLAALLASLASPDRLAAGAEAMSPARRARDGAPRPTRRSPRQSPPARRRPGLVPGARAVAALAAGALVGAWCLADLGASRAAFDAVNWLPQRPGESVARSVQSARRAMALDPADDLTAYHASDVLARASLGVENPVPLLEEAEAAARRSVALEPRRFLGHQKLGSVLLRRAQLGDTAALATAIRAFDDALALAPVNALPMLELASGLLDMDRPDLARPYAERAAELYPDQDLPRLILSRVR